MTSRFCTRTVYVFRIAASHHPRQYLGYRNQHSIVLRALRQGYYQLLSCSLMLVRDSAHVKPIFWNVSFRQLFRDPDLKPITSKDRSAECLLTVTQFPQLTEELRQSGPFFINDFTRPFNMSPSCFEKFLPDFHNINYFIYSYNLVVMYLRGVYRLCPRLIVNLQGQE